MYIFGDEPDVKTLLSKLCVDQFLWTPLYMGHINYWLNWFFNNNLMPAVCTTKTLKHYLFNDFVVSLVSGYIIWIPSCLVIYSMTESLQVVTMNIIGVFYIIIMTAITTKPKSDDVITDN